jgi:ribosomal-protein-alanine N-acetyltransferase
MDELWEPAGRLVTGPRVNMLTLETERLLLRGFTQDDLRDVIDWDDGGYSHDVEPGAQQFLDFCFRQYEQPGIGPWGMLLKEIGRIVGNCGYIGLQHFCGEVNYFVAPQYRGQGLAPEALRALLNFGFSDLGLLRIQARCELDNLSSERVMQKIGMKLNQVPRGVSANDKCRNEKIYAILRQDFRCHG